MTQLKINGEFDNVWKKIWYYTDIRTFKHITNYVAYSEIKEMLFNKVHYKVLDNIQVHWNIKGMLKDKANERI
jgi:hypothetical protein